MAFVAGEDIKAGTAVWLHCHKLIRATSASLEVRIPLGGGIHTPMIIGVTRTKAKRDRKVPVVLHGYVKLPKTHPEWLLKSAWATSYGAILPWELVQKGKWAKKVGWFTSNGIIVMMNHCAKRKTK